MNKADSKTQTGWPYDAGIAPFYEEAVEWPKISIVIPSFNQGKFIEETLLSIVHQHYPNLEVVFIDGGSKDNTMEIVQQFESLFTYRVSEPDRGQSHAINKGVERVTGEIFNWLNTDDYLLPGALKHIAVQFIQNPAVHAVVAKSIKFGAVKTAMTVPRDLQHDSIEDFLLNFWIMQPSAYMRTEVFKPLFPLNENLHYSMDTDLYVRYLLGYGNENLNHSDMPILKFRMHHDSKSVSSQLAFNRERMMIDQQMVNAICASHALQLNSLEGAESILLAPYEARAPFDAEKLQTKFLQKWYDWEIDPSAKYRKVAEFAGWYGHKGMMRKFSLKALLVSPFKMLNWKYLFSSFKP